MLKAHSKVKVPDGRDEYADWILLRDNALMFARMLRACETTRPRPRYTVRVAGSPYRAVVTVSRKTKDEATESSFAVDIRDGSAHFWFQPYLESAARILR